MTIRSQQGQRLPHHLRQRMVAMVISSPYAAVKKGPRKNNATYSTINPVVTRSLTNTAWYNKIDTRNAKYSHTDLVSLQRVVDIVVKYITGYQG